MTKTGNAETLGHSTEKVGAIKDFNPHAEQAFDSREPIVQTDSGENVSQVQLLPLWTDRRLSELTGFAISTFRGQRYLRRHGQDHWFDIDPVPSCPAPRYRHEDVVKWFKRFTGVNN